MNKYFAYLKGLPKDVKKYSLFLFFTYFFILFTYPFTRSATQVLLLESYGAEKLPLTWFLSIVTLSIVIFICNRIQSKIGVHKLFSLLSFFTILVFAGGVFLYQLGIKEMSMLMFIWKEVYIVVLIHLFLAFCNGYFSIDQIKFLYGPLGAMGSLGGIVGGQLTSLLAKTSGTNSILYASFVILTFSLLAFRKTRFIDLKEEDDSLKEKASPLAATKGIRGYVFLIAAIIALSQFVINIADLQFNIIFEKVVETKDQRSFFLGQLYSLVNFFSLLIQFIVLPIVLTKIKTRTAHFFVPLFYLGLVALGFGLGGSLLWPVATVFVGMKATDYSLFAVIKELLYHPLSRLQKYGAKYIADMWTYRTAKAVIALLLMFVNSLALLSGLQFLFIVLWVICVILIFRKHAALGDKNESITKT